MAAKSFGRYRLVRLLARGGMAEVYLAVLRGAAGFEKRLVIKKILPIYGDLEEFTRLFTDEARISVSLSHSNIVQVFDFGVNNGDHFIAMEYVDGPDLEKVLIGCRKLKTQLSIDALLYASTRIAAALEYAHSRVDDSGRSLQLVHRDVSPPNVLLSVEGEVKLTDFGVAKYQQRLSKSRPGVVRGKYAYMSPEQLTGQPLDHRSDLFSLGTVLYEMLTAKNPFVGPTDYQTMEAVVAANPQNPLELRPDAPHDLVRIIQRCLSGHADSRYQRAGDIRRDLAELMFNRGVIDDPLLLMEELWRLFPKQLKRRGGEAPEAKPAPRPAPGAGAAALGMPRMRAGSGVSPVDEWGRQPGGGNVIQLGPADEEFGEDDATIPALANQDVVPTQPLDGGSHTLESVPKGLRQLGATPKPTVSDPFGAIAPRKKADGSRPRIEVKDPFVPAADAFNSTDPALAAFDAAAPTMERPHEDDTEDEEVEMDLSLDDIEMPPPSVPMPVLPRLGGPSAETTMFSVGAGEPGGADESDEFAYLRGVAAPGDETVLSADTARVVAQGDQTLLYTGPPADLNAPYKQEPPDAPAPGDSTLPYTGPPAATGDYLQEPDDDEPDSPEEYPETADPASETLLEMPAPTVPLPPPPIPRRGGVQQTVPSAARPLDPASVAEPPKLRPWTRFEEVPGTEESTAQGPYGGSGDEPPTDEGLPAVPDGPAADSGGADELEQTEPEAAAVEGPVPPDLPLPDAPPPPAQPPPQPDDEETADEGSPWPIILAFLVTIILVFLFRGSISQQNDEIMDDVQADPPTVAATPEPRVPEPSASTPSPEASSPEVVTPEASPEAVAPEASPEAVPPEVPTPAPVAPAEPDEAEETADAAAVGDASPGPTATPASTSAPPEVTPRPRPEPTPEARTPAPSPEPVFEPAAIEPTPAPRLVPEPAFEVGGREGSSGGTERGGPDDEFTVAITVDSRPKGARLTIRGTPVGRAPHQVWGKPGEILEISASLDGYLKTTRMVRVAEGDERALIELSPEPSPAANADADMGKLVITSNPWAYVTVDGRQLGRVTPVTLDLKPGRHTVVLDNPDTGWSEARTVTVEANKTLKLDVKR